jgi:hypothetical protein
VKNLPRRCLPFCAATLLACGSGPIDPPGGQPPDGGVPDAPVRDAVPSPHEAGPPPERFVTEVVSFTPGACAGFGIPAMPGVVQGPPRGAGALFGGTDVVSLGERGEIVLGFSPWIIVDGDGPDFLVFENAFWAGGDPNKPFADPGEVSVSDDGEDWRTFPCTATQFPWGACSGWHPVYSSPENGISPFDPAKAGGEAYDLADVGLARARFVRIRDVGFEKCPQDPSLRTTTVGYDLDAVAVVNGQRAL